MTHQDPRQTQQRLEEAIRASCPPTDEVIDLAIHVLGYRYLDAMKHCAIQVIDRTLGLEDEAGVPA